MRFKDLSGKRFGRLTVVRFAGKSKAGQSLWRCLCDCGNEGTFQTGHLGNGHSKSCGCLRAEVVGEKNTTHGLSEVLEYGVWKSMKHRCLSKKRKDYKDYGARGITVCKRWLNSFENFYNDMGPRPSPQHSIDRIDNNKGYSPKNCRWATRSVQNNNKRNVARITHQGESLTKAEWAQKVGINYPTLARRLDRGWSFERAIQP